MANGSRSVRIVDHIDTCVGSGAVAPGGGVTSPTVPGDGGAEIVEPVGAPTAAKARELRALAPLAAKRAMMAPSSISLRANAGAAVALFATRLNISARA
ncbi:MAG: hypothetical protein M3081_18075 [Gemmatimonadota bacterium]|nr:hypothetical protein [Gemmatimonadota bacterium]